MMLSRITRALPKAQTRGLSSISREARFFPKTSADSLMRKASSTAQEQTPGAAFNKIAFIGIGKMAQAILNPIVETGMQPAEQIMVFDKHDATVESVLSQNPGVQTASSVSSAVQDADFVVCAVKPQNLDASFWSEIRDAPNRPAHGTFLSVMAGVGLNALEPAGYDKIVRSMPNTPAMIGRGMTVWCCTPNLDVTERERVHNVLSCLGKTMYVDSERHVDMSTAISGSGPAYIFNLMEDMIDAGVHMGFPRDKATTLVYHTLLGSTLYAMETGEHPAILRNNVTSPSGTTASAIYELENGGFNKAVKDAMWACYRRSLEMGNQDSNVGPGRSTVPLSAEGVILEQLLDSNNVSVKVERKTRNPGDYESDEEPERVA